MYTSPASVPKGSNRLLENKYCASAGGPLIILINARPKIGENGGVDLRPECPIAWGDRGLTSSRLRMRTSAPPNGSLPADYQPTFGQKCPKTCGSPTNIYILVLSGALPQISSDLSGILWCLGREKFPIKAIVHSFPSKELMIQLTKIPINRGY